MPRCLADLRQRQGLLLLVLLLVVVVPFVCGQFVSADEEGPLSSHDEPKKKKRERFCDDTTDCQQDRVYHLPGRVAPPLPSPWYSGYLTYDFENRTVHTHYVLVLAEDDDEGSAAQDDKQPLIYWTNGGPGASSLFGLFTEVGPFRLNYQSRQTANYRATSVPTLLYNPYSWTKLGHVLVLDHPPPVGFSYCGNNSSSPLPRDGGATCQGLGWTDALAAANHWAALQAFYAKFPALLYTDLYLTGESYAGIYVPTLARLILQSNKKNAAKANAPDIPLRGLAVGDGCLGTETGICKTPNQAGEEVFDFWLVWFLAGHGQLPLPTFLQVLRACQPFHDDDDDEPRHKDSAVCKAALAKVHEQVGGVYDYSLYDECTYSHDDGDGMSTDSSSSSNDYACGGDVVMSEYLQLEAVRQALHIPAAVDFFEVDNAVGFDYTFTEKDLTGFYRQLAAEEKNVTVLIYNGDVDPNITSFAAQNWTEHLGLNVQQEWRPWTVDGCRRMGGYVTRYDGQLDFVTIRGAGHMVPTIKPAAMRTLLHSWIAGQDYPPYVASCTRPPGNAELRSRGPGDAFQIAPVVS